MTRNNVWRAISVALFVFAAALSARSVVAQGVSVPKFVDKPGETYYDFGDHPMRYLENDRVKIGFDLSIGGAVVYLEDKANKSGNMINSFDWGRQIQLSYYSGPNPYVGPNGEKPSSDWAGLGWNPIQAGDCGGYGSRVLDFKYLDIPGGGAYIRTRPMLWPNIGVLAECVFVCVYKLTPNGFELSATIINDRADKTQYLGRTQETPAVYTNAPWYKLVTYLGDKPFENEPLATMVDKGDGKGWPWVGFYTPERWTALVNEKNFGLGVYQPNAVHSSGGFHGGDGAKGLPLGPKETATGYIAPHETTILDWNITRTYKTTFVVGSLDEIRETVYKLAKRDLKTRPEWVFEKDRQNWIYTNTTDEGFPIQGALKINLLPNAEACAQSSEDFWKTKDAPILEVDLALEDVGAVEKKDETLKFVLTPFSPADTIDYLQWSEGDKDQAREREEKHKTRPVLPNIEFSAPVKFDGERRVVRVDLRDVKGYDGAMKRLALLFPARNAKATLYSVRFVEK